MSMSLNYPRLISKKYSQEYTRSYETRYVAEISHQGINAFRIMKDLDSLLLERKVNAQLIKWDEQYTKQELKRTISQEKESNQTTADEMTREATDVQYDIENTLLHTLDIDDTVDWETLKDFSTYEEENPINRLDEEISKYTKPVQPVYKSLPTKPLDSEFTPKLNIINKIIKSSKDAKLRQAEKEFRNALEMWEKHFAQIEEDNAHLGNSFEEELKQVNIQIESTRQLYISKEEQWREDMKEFYAEQERSNTKVDSLKEQYGQHHPDAVLEYCEMVLNNSLYPDFFPRDFELEYNPETKILIVEYTLPAPEDLPSLKEVKYIAAKRELKEYHLSEAAMSKNYDSLIYKIFLRTIHELFEADQANALDCVSLNGWVSSINKATGKIAKNCIVSIQVKKAEFEEIDLSRVDPKVCFKSLKGIGSSKLSGITPIQPIMNVSREDKRFVDSYDVTNSIQEGDNLASMDWEDFEHLMREIFTKEFNSTGGEVKVTRASKDGGVDAVAFDPDPIRGGKIVIQAKRYSNTVGVSAVRDLYGTVMNEGATKGILVSTADYGPDAYEFARNKPLTLMNGANLLYLMEKHGHKARIDLVEARLTMKGKQ